MSSISPADALRCWMELQYRINAILNANVRPEGAEPLPVEQLDERRENALLLDMRQFIAGLPGPNVIPRFWIGHFFPVDELTDAAFLRMVWQEIRDYRRHRVWHAAGITCQKCLAEWPISEGKCEQCEWESFGKAVELTPANWERYFLLPFRAHSATVATALTPTKRTRGLSDRGKCILSVLESAECRSSDGTIDKRKAYEIAKDKCKCFGKITKKMVDNIAHYHLTSKRGGNRPT